MSASPHWLGRIDTTVTTYAAGTTYVRPVSGTQVSNQSFEVEATTPMPAGTIENLWVNISANTAAGSCTFASRKNGADGALLITVPGGSTGAFTDLTNSDTLALNDLFCIRMIIPDNVLTLRTMGWTLSSSGMVTILGHGAVNANVNTTRYRPLGGGATFGAWSVAEADGQCKMPAGTLRRLRVYVLTNAKAASFQVDCRVNAASSTLTVTVPAGTTGAFFDTTHTETVAAGGQDCAFMMAATETGAATIAGISVEFVSADGTQTPVVSDWGTVTVNFNTPANVVGVGGRWASFPATPVADSVMYQYARAARTATNLRTRLSTNTCDGISTLTLRNGGVDTALVLSLPASTTGFFEDATHSASVAAGDGLTLRIVPAGTSGAFTPKGTTLWLYEPQTRNVTCVEAAALTGPASVSLLQNVTRQEALALQDAQAATRRQHVTRAESIGLLGAQFGSRSRTHNVTRLESVALLDARSGVKIPGLGSSIISGYGDWGVRVASVVGTKETDGGPYNLNRTLLKFGQLVVLVTGLKAYKITMPPAPQGLGVAEELFTLPYGALNACVHEGQIYVATYKGGGAGDVYAIYRWDQSSVVLDHTTANDGVSNVGGASCVVWSDDTDVYIAYPSGKANQGEGTTIRKRTGGTWDRMTIFNGTWPVPMSTPWSACGFNGQWHLVWQNGNPDYFGGPDLISLVAGDDYYHNLTGASGVGGVSTPVRFSQDGKLYVATTAGLFQLDPSEPTAALAVFPLDFSFLAPALFEFDGSLYIGSESYVYGEGPPSPAYLWKSDGVDMNSWTRLGIE